MINKYKSIDGRFSLKSGVSILSFIVATMVGSAAFAQTHTDDHHTGTEDIIVTGTGTNISGVKAVGSDIIVIDSTKIRETGMTSAADVVRTLPQVRNLGSFREGGTQGSDNAQQGNAINLRGLGPSATLVLIDGRRLVATGAASTFTEANQVPLAALERIEVITDGASAVYGSDAVAGVVNYVLRKDFEGIEASVRMSNNTGGAEVSPSITAGTNWDFGGLGKGNIIVSYEHTRRDAYLRGRNKWLRQDLRPVGGADLRLDGVNASPGSPGNIFVPTQTGSNPDLPRAGGNIYYGLPVGSNGIGLTPSDLRLNDPNLIDTSAYTDYTGELTRNQVTAFFNQELGERVTFFAQGTYTHRKTFSQQLAGFAGSIVNLTMPAFLYDPVTNQPDFTRPNPAYINGIPGVMPGADLNVQYNFVGSTGPNNWSNRVENYSITSGLKVKLPSGWNAEGFYTYGYDEACNWCNVGNNINNDTLQYFINTGVVNPLSTAPLSSDVLSRMYGDNIQQSTNTFNNWFLKFDGPLFALPAGSVKAAFGGEINKQANWNVNGRNRGLNNEMIIDTDKNNSIGRRTIKSAFAEVFVPLIGEDMGVPLMRELTLSGAVRHDDYSDVGNTTNPKLGLTWVVANELTLRGSWGRSFRAPGLPDVNPQAFSSGFVFSGIPNGNPNIVNDFCFTPTCEPVLGTANGGTTVGLIYGADPTITPEKAKNWSIGADFTPVRNLKVSGTYYNITYSNRIVQPGFGLFNNFINPGYPDYAGYEYGVIPINNTNVTGPNSCNIDPILQAYLDRPIMYGTQITNPCNLRVLLDGRAVNLAATKQTGIDFVVDYSIPFDDGAILFNASVNKILNNKQQVTPGTAFVDVKSRSDQPIEWMGRGSIGGMWNGFSTMLFVNYVGSYENWGAINPITGNPVPTQKVKSWTTFDLNLGYNGTIAGGFLKGFRASLNIQNLTDKDPPRVVTANGAFNASYSNPFGRTFTVQLSTSF